MLVGKMLRTTTMPTGSSCRKAWFVTFFVFVSLGCGGVKADLCPDFSPNPGAKCIEVNSWTEFLSVISSNDSDNEFNLCPFDIQKDDSGESAVINRGIKIKCMRKTDEDRCTIRGPGTHLRVATSEDTLFQGLTFRESNDYAVHIISETETAMDATHTFCHCSLIDNERTKSSRGGAFKTESNAGTVNLVNSVFADNFATTYGAAIYTRTNQMNIIRTQFVDNVAIGWGGAIFSAADASIMIKESTFLRNFGQGGYAAVVKPRSGSGVWTDGFDNESSGGECDGFYQIADRKCETYVASPTDSPTSTSAPTSSPTATPFPSISPTASVAPTSVSDTFCSFEPDATPCTDISSYSDLMAAIEGSNKVVLCGGFKLRKPEQELIVISKDVEIRCQKLCTLYGSGTHMRIEGLDTHVRIHNMKLANSDSSAIEVMTGSTQAVTTLCSCQFWNNKTPGGIGGALKIGSGSGVVNVVTSHFANNQASSGGAIFSKAHMLNVVGSKFVANKALNTGSAIFSDTYSHILIKSSMFGLNEITASLSGSDNAVAVLPLPVSQSETAGVYVDAGMNTILLSGSCEGFYVLATGACEVFDAEVGRPVVYPYIPGELSQYDLTTGIRLSTGLAVREIARSGSTVPFTSGETDHGESSTQFHEKPNGAATFALADGGWVYMSSSEFQNSKGGVYAIFFDREGEVRDYQPRLLGTSRNNNGGASPFDSFISCEVIPTGRCWQVDPFGERDPEVATILGEGFLESFAYDLRDPINPVFFVTEYQQDGALRAVKPGSANAEWEMLTEEAGSTTEYLVLDPKVMGFRWTTNATEAEESAETHYPHSEGLSQRDGMLYMTSKDLSSIFALDLDGMAYVTYNTTQAILNDGGFDQEGDQLLQITDSILYMAENGGPNPGVYGLDLTTGTYFAVFEAFAEEHMDADVTGIAFSPDWKRFYACFDSGLMLEITRQDGLPFEETF